MRRLPFDDYCVIRRDSKSYDEYDNPMQEVVYSGQCCYQDKSYTNAQQMLMRNPLVFLPEVSALIDTNDVVEITTKFGREFKAIVNISREIELPHTHIRVTRLELKQGEE